MSDIIVDSNINPNWNVYGYPIINQNETHKTNMLYGNTPITFFIEGYDTIGYFYVYVKTNVDYVMLERFESPDIQININPSFNYIVSYDGKVRPVKSNMIKGFISGTVDYADCDGSTFFIRCYCVDGFHVGDYPITNGNYNIPNLDVNNQYDVCLIDSTSYLETKVHSKRTPTLYP